MLLNMFMVAIEIIFTAFSTNPQNLQKTTERIETPIKGSISPNITTDQLV